METTTEASVLTQRQSCAVCGTKENLISADILNAYNRTCEKHKEYVGHFQLDKVRVALGYLDKLPDACCEVCDKQLSVEELNSIGPKDFTKACSEHRWTAWSAILPSKFRQQYKDGLPFTHEGRVYSKENPRGTAE